ncbi:histidine kinase dimerization/phosphoacceptor domain -containing protein [uncultured Methanobacterium sp.]|uniref:histidine kinase dimerization/phosphoacceptor domain -containing protein n=1 Tax=uncultured Methanobacterium sp. TaxID=176306 RepID=UPI002AA60AFD|nr:histidine kinase dimerization/phosphoacceptor domain -containing protein [uncultured Methanobacterium sp.]
MAKKMVPKNGMSDSEPSVLHNKNTNKKQLKKVLSSDELDLKEIMNVSPVPQFVINKDHNVIYWNHALEKLSNIPADNILGTNKQWQVFYNTERPCMADFIVNGRLEEIPKWYNTKDNRSKFVLRYQGSSKNLGNSCEAVAFFPLMGEQGKWLHFTVDTIKNAKGNVIGAVETFEDVTEQINLQDKFIKTLEEKELLLREIHHRTRNDLQIIDSMINFQSYYTDDEKSLKLFKDIQDHIKSMTQIHEKIYHSKDLLKIDFGVFIKNLVFDRLRAYGIGKNTIQVDIDSSKVLLDINTAISCGIIVNELVNDSINRILLTAELKESEDDEIEDPNHLKGEISVNINNKGEFFLMTVYDDAKVSPENLDLQSNKNALDMWFLNKLATELGGTVNLEQKNGTLFKITFKKNNVQI